MCHAVGFIVGLWLLTSLCLQSREELDALLPWQLKPHEKSLSLNYSSSSTLCSPCSSEISPRRDKVIKFSLSCSQPLCSSSVCIFNTLSNCKKKKTMKNTWVSQTYKKYFNTSPYSFFAIFFVKWVRADLTATLKCVLTRFNFVSPLLNIHVKNVFLFHNRWIFLFPGIWALLVQTAERRWDSVRISSTLWSTTSEEP